MRAPFVREVQLLTSARQEFRNSLIPFRPPCPPLIALYVRAAAALPGRPRHREERGGHGTGERDTPGWGHRARGPSWGRGSGPASCGTRRDWCARRGHRGTGRRAARGTGGGTAGCPSVPWLGLVCRIPRVPRGAQRCPRRLPRVSPRAACLKLIMINCFGVSRWLLLTGTKRARVCLRALWSRLQLHQPCTLQ